jgi:uncharacterized membrane protein YedE/YeeE
MRRSAAAAAAIGTVFGLSLSWSGMANPDVLRDGLLFRSSYLYLFFASALLTSAVGLRLLRRANTRAVLTQEAIGWTTDRPERRHVVGSAMFGVGWAVADACPGPVAALLGQGILWGVPTAAGIAARRLAAAAGAGARRRGTARSNGENVTAHTGPAPPTGPRARVRG